MTNLASHSTSNPSSISQYAALAAYTEQGDNDLHEMVDAFKTRLNNLYELIVSIPGVSCVKPQGAFYLFPNVKEAIKITGHSDVDDGLKHY